MAPTTDDDDKYNEQNQGDKGVHPLIAIILIASALIVGLFTCNVFIAIFF